MEIILNLKLDKRLGLVAAFVVAVVVAVAPKEEYPPGYDAMVKDYQRPSAELLAAIKAERNLIRPYPPQ